MAIKIDANALGANIKPQVVGVRVDERLMGHGKYEVTPSSYFSVKVPLRLVDKRWVIDRSKPEVEHTVVFRLWSFDEMTDLRKKATSYDMQKRIHTVDNDLLDRMKVQKLLMSWTFDVDNPRLKLHRVNDVMTDESWDNFKKLQVGILKFILDEMNHVLEYNG